MTVILEYLEKLKEVLSCHYFTSLRNLLKKACYLPLGRKRISQHYIINKGDKSLPSNYHPVSLTSVICKMLETIVKSELVNYFVQNNLFSTRQHGFRACFGLDNMFWISGQWPWIWVILLT